MASTEEQPAVDQGNQEIPWQRALEFWPSDATPENIFSFRKMFTSYNYVFFLRAITVRSFSNHQPQDPWRIFFRGSPGRRAMEELWKPFRSYGKSMGEIQKLSKEHILDHFLEIRNP
jgi:hypothetical protein